MARPHRTPATALASARLTAGLLLAAIAVAPLHARPKVDQLPPSTRLTLDNGLEAILIPNTTAPLVTSVAVVRAGSSRETPAINGISHMLEHLLFSGTAKRTHQEIAEAPGRLGLVNNAQTAAEHTAYFVLAPRERFGEALDLQADMLFGSTLPEERLGQERDIIANEIAKDQVSDETVLGDLYAARMYPGALGLPVIGTPETVRAIPRDELLRYYRRWYVPNNMTLIVMGDFEAPEMEVLLRRIFGSVAPGLLPEPPKHPPAVNTAALGKWHSVKTDGPRRLWMGAPAPGMTAAAFSPARALAMLMDDGLLAAVNARLSASGKPGALREAGVSLDARARVGSLRVAAALDDAVAWDDAATALSQEVQDRLKRAAWRTRDLDRIRLDDKASFWRLWEKPHYFGLDRAPYVAGAGWDLARDASRHLGWVEPADLKDLAHDLVPPQPWALFASGPKPPADEGAAAAGAAQPNPAEPRSTSESRRLVEAWRAPAAPVETVPPSLGPRAAPAARQTPLGVRTYLSNGMLVVLDSTDDSRVFAAHVLARGRSQAQPPGKAGIAELLHMTAAAAGTRAHPGEKLREALRAIGGSLKAGDDPSIPYDDIYLSPEYSYIRLEALDEFAPEALDLLREILSEPAFRDAAAFAAARDQLAARARRAESSPRDRARLALARALWGDDHPFAFSPFGTTATVPSISPEDLAAFHASYFAPRNLIVAIGTSHPPEAILSMLEARLGRWKLPGAPADRALPAPRGGASGAPREVVESLDGPQSYVAWGRLAPEDASPEEMTALAAVLSARMSATLREQRGLAYSLGSEAAAIAGRVQWTAGMGVLPEKVEPARQGLREVLLGLASNPPTQQEIDDASRDAHVRSLMRGLSRINRAWRRCVDEMGRRSGAASAAAVPPSGPPGAERAAALARALINEASLDPWVEVVVRRPESAAAEQR